MRLFFDVDGAGLRLGGAGPEERPTVVIVRTGPGTDHTAFKEHIGPALAAHAQVVYLDLRGCGDSDRSDPEHWNLETWSDDLRVFCDVLGLDRPVVLGAGWGGFTVLRYAQRWPEHPAKLVLTNPNARVLADRSDGGRSGVCVPRAPVGADGRRVPARLLPRDDHRPACVRPDDAVELESRARRPLVRTLIAAGTDDPAYPYASIQEVIAGMPGAQVEVFEGARHSVFRDEPESIAAVERFVRM